MYYTLPLFLFFCQKRDTYKNSDDDNKISKWARCYFTREYPVKDSQLLLPKERNNINLDQNINKNIISDKQIPHESYSLLAMINILFLFY